MSAICRPPLAGERGHPRHFRMKRPMANVAAMAMAMAMAKWTVIVFYCCYCCWAVDAKRLLSPLEESQFDEVDCFPGGTVCDLVPIKIEEEFSPKINSLPDRRQNIINNVTTAQYSNSLHFLLTFTAFGRHFRLAVKADRKQIVGKRKEEENCFFSGHVISGSSEDSTVALNLCGSAVSGHFQDEEGGYYTITSAVDEDKEKQLHRIFKSKSLPLIYESQIDLTEQQRLRRSPHSRTPPSPTWPPESKDNWVEIMVVADGPMVKYHGDKLEQYILTLMDIVSLIYRDKSLGNSVQLAVVKLIILDESESFAPKNRDADTRISASDMLKAFCKWQGYLGEYSGQGGEHQQHDVSLLITRENICRNPDSPSQNCDTLGLAELGTMCDKHSCAIVQDNGLSAAFTIAHELGHVLNMPHDDDQKCIEFASPNSSVSYVMSRMLDHNTNPWEWSACSSHYATGFLDANYGHCLGNKPTNNLLETSGRNLAKYPGEYFDENKQCEFVFGHDSKICSYMPPCSRLWCTTSGGEENGCRTQHMPWADGTKCGEGRWCIKSQCVPKTKDVAPPVNGRWGDWKSWSSCSRTCGGGIRKSVRDCNKPAPLHGGLYCTGDRVRYESCNTWDCPKGSNDFRLEQCEEFNGKNFLMEGVPDDVKWVPKYAGIRGPDKCKLFCRIQDSSAYYLLAASVIDGTPCGADTFHACVNGQCIPAGCDHVLGAQKTLDWCGICGGNNSTCQEERGVYNVTKYGYNFVVRIPAGATNIEIRQYGFGRNSNDDTYIALRDVDSGQYILNGDFVMSMFRKTIQYAGMTLEYSGSDTAVERINSSQPLRKDLIVEVLTVGNLYPPQVHYNYVISRPSSESYRWMTRSLPKWSHCDKQCRGKQQSSTAVCVQSQAGLETEVDEKYCSYLPRPKSVVKDCNMHCSLEWRAVSRASCSAKCGPGVRKMSYGCMMVMANQPDLTLPDQYCEMDLPKPATSEDCEGPCEGVKWSYGAWSDCTKTCGGGRQQRIALCVDSEGNSIDEDNCSDVIRVIEQNCQQETCPKWMTGDWTECNATCGIGVRQRPYWCEVDQKKIDGRYCIGESIPRHMDVCTEKPCSSWSIGNWSECSSPCGPGVRQREVFCEEELTGNKLDDKHCAHRARPLYRALCIGRDCDRIQDDSQVNKENKEQLEDAEENEVLLEGPMVDDDDDSEYLKHHRLYKPAHRYRWKVGPWQKCSRECGSGLQERAVACFDSHHNVRVMQLHCKKHIPNKPMGQRQCSLQDCTEGKWLMGEWQPCSVTCDKGIQTRSVSCVSSATGLLIENTYCKGDPPAREQICPDTPDCRHQVPQSSHIEHNEEDVLAIFHWRKGEWSTCSQTCGGGLKRRAVACQDDNGNFSSNCDDGKKPPEQISCNTEPCPRWNFGRWGQCDKPCGAGVQQRLVRCQDHLGQTMPDLKCELSSRPHNSRECNSDPCKAQRRPKYLWKRSGWSACSKSCDKGASTRTVQCVNISNGGKVVDDGLCLSSVPSVGNSNRRRRHGRKPRDLQKPKMKKSCNKLPCPFAWVPGQWSECTHSCGKGVQHRRVTCHRVNAYGWSDPEPVSHGCSNQAGGKPPEVQTCVVADCGARYMWTVEPWGACSWEGKGCGKKGRQRRTLHCLDADGNKVAKRLCKKYLVRKPKRSRQCGKKICGYENCQDMKARTGVNKDGEYQILFAGRNVTIYCHDMTSEMPKEYLTLPRGDKENYSEIYGMRLIEPNSCPFNGTRNDKCDCVRDARRREGLTGFTKIRVNVTSLKVNTHDFEFATQVRGQIVPFGEAGDCYSTANCPQGQFGIDLTGTGLRVSPYTGWVGQGNRPSLWLKRETENQVIHGKCGGYCGTCVPEPHNGLKLDLLPPSSSGSSNGGDG